MTTESGERFDGTELESILLNYNQHIRKGTRLSKRLECFDLSNLANYDPKNTSMKFTRSEG